MTDYTLEVDLCKNCNTMKHLDANGLCGQCAPDDAMKELDEILSDFNDFYLHIDDPQYMFANYGMGYSLVGKLQETKQALIQWRDTYAAALVREVIGEDNQKAWDDDSWFCQRCNFAPTDDTKHCICYYRNKLRAEQRARLHDLTDKGGI